MLLNSLEHIAFRVGGLAAVIYGLEKTSILQKIISAGDSDITTAVKTSALLSGSEFVSDHLLSYLTNVKVPSLYKSVGQFGIAFVVNALTLYALDKMDIDSIIVKSNSNDEMKALEFGVLFVLVNEISYKVISMYLNKY